MTEHLEWPKLVTNEGAVVNGDEYALLSGYRSGGSGKGSWSPTLHAATYLISLRDGSRKAVNRTSTLSPDGHFVVYYDAERRAYFSYDIATGRTRNITPSVTTNWNGYRYDGRKGSPRGMAGWVRDDSAVLIYDRNDLWQIDPRGQSAPLNLTGGFGSRHDIIFRLLDVEARNGEVRDGHIFEQHQEIVLAALNQKTKDSGFFGAIVGEGQTLKQLGMGPYIYHWPGLNLPSENSLPPAIKARDATIYLVRRMSATEAPNVFSTRDFVTFTPLTDVRPERQFNWLTSELMVWKLPNGKVNQGILYKPEDFDPSKKYPVIFQIYEEKSNGLHAYVLPGALDGGCNINLASYVSHGYLVFSPDIFPRVGHPGQSALESVDSAVKYLSKRPWIDTKRMGIEGCSYGGFEANFVVTHSKAFAAAVVASGGTDFVSYYGELGGGGESQQDRFESGQYRILASLWKRPDLYIENSPVLSANHVVTPLLIMHTPADAAVPFAQAVELFTGLRRLGKKAWMLQYDIGNHGLFDRLPAGDFSVRMAQFFDHYLKGSPPPKWMTEGIPARLKGIDTGLEIDRSGTEP
jgi:dienelactone hydrolase